MAQNIVDFYRAAQTKDFARLFQFRLLQLGRVPLQEDQLVYVETASLPGRSINQVAVPYMGLSFNVPGTASYPGSTGYQVTFRCDADYDIRSLLEQETFKTFNDDTSTGDYSIPGPDSVLTMALLGPGDRATGPSIVRVYNLYGVYVQALADVGYDIKDAGNVATVQATLAYQYWRAENKTATSTPGVDVKVPKTFSGSI